jgi:quercetin dioxygenase-like cupin family protein
MGTTPDHDNAQVLAAGSFFALTPGSAHYFFADEDTGQHLLSMMTSQSTWSGCVGHEIPA